MSEANGSSSGGEDGRIGGDDRSAGQLTMVEIAQELERVMSLIEAERVKEREARKVYKEVADAVEAEIGRIRERAKTLVQEQQRRMSSFHGFIGDEGAAQSAQDGRGASISEVKPVRRSGAGGVDGPPRTIQDAVMRVWTLEGHDRPLTTDEIAEALPEVGYESKAAPRSLKSTLNQALAKLTRDGQMQKYRIDGSPIHPDESGARARRYMPAGMDSDEA